MKPNNEGAQINFFKLIPGVMLGLALLWLAGCASADGRPRALEADYGRSVNNARLQQMITPPDAVDPRPALGLTPQAAQNSQGKYDASFAEKKQERTVIPLITTNK